MALDTSLSQRQVDVLRWISDGCPDGRWPDFTFKTTANALASRRLVTVSKRGGVWSAAILPAGAHYLESGQYPPDHWAKRRRGGVDLNTPLQPAAVARRPVASPSEGAVPVRPKVQQRSSRARDLVAEVVAAGGELRRESKEGPRAFSLLVSAVNRFKLAPEGKQLTLGSGGGWGNVVIRLEDAPYWLTTPAPEVVAAQRINRWHPSIADLRENEFMSMALSAERRMLRILQALATEAEARGHLAKPAAPSRWYHHRQSEAGHVCIGIRDHRYTIAVWQKFRETPPPRWGKPPKRPDPELGDSLAVGLIWESGGRSGISESWSDSPAKRIKVESLLPTVLWELERRADSADQRRKQEELAATERERLQAEAERRARIVHAENVRAETLRDQHRRWRDAIGLREFLAAMGRAIDNLTDESQKTAASAWRDWCQAYVDTTVDPLGQSLATPDIREWTHDERNDLEKKILRQLKREKERSSGG